MSTNFPTSLDTPLNPAGSDALSNATPGLQHHVQHDNVNDAIVALETKLGITGSDKNQPLSVYATGTPYSIVVPMQLLTFGTTSPSLTINKAGTYLVLARVRQDRNNASHINRHTITYKLRRTNNTAADLTNGTTAYVDEPHAAMTETEDIVPLPSVLYTTTNTNDVIELWGNIDIVTTGGTHDAVEAEIVAVRLY
jgi:hypothetical protein